MKNIKTPKLHLLFAKAMEAAGKYDRSVLAYEAAHDPDSVVRICLQHLNMPEKAFSMVRESASSHGAEIVADYCKSNGNIRPAIEFMLMSNRSAEAFDLAKNHNEMDVFAEMLGENGSAKEYYQIAAHYESKSEWSKVYIVQIEHDVV